MAYSRGNSKGLAMSRGQCIGLPVVVSPIRASIVTDASNEQPLAVRGVV